MVITVSENSHKYQSLYRPTGSGGDFASLVTEAQKKFEKSEKNYDLSDMYIRTHQTLPWEAVKMFGAAAKPWMDRNNLQVPAAGDLRELMESIETGLLEGRPLRDILQERIDRYARESGIEGCIAVGGDQADLFLINPETGMIVESSPKSRCIIINQESDYSIARSQADDLATFIRYTVFRQETDDPEKVSALLTELKEKQLDYDTSRFLPIFYSYGEQGWKNSLYLRKLLGLDDEDEESEEDGSNEAADELMKIVGRHNSSDAGNDVEPTAVNAAEPTAVVDLMDLMNAENIGKSKVAKRVLNAAFFREY